MIVLDASALLVVLLDKQGRDAVDLLLETKACAASLVNVSEAHERLLEQGATNTQARRLIDDLDVRFVSLDRPIAELAAILRGPTKNQGVGIADRICIATGMLHDAPIFTADRSWAKLDLPEADIQIVR